MLLCTESDDGNVLVPLDKVLDCLTSCIHVAHVNHMLEHTKNLMQVFLISLSPGFQWTGILFVFFFVFPLDAMQC